MKSHDMGRTAASFPERIWPEIDVAARIRRSSWPPAPSSWAGPTPRMQRSRTSSARLGRRLTRLGACHQHRPTSL